MKEAFKEQGYFVERSLFSEAECQEILKSIRADEFRPPLVWDKGTATTSPAWYALAKHDRFTDRVSELIGEDLILWGAQSLLRVPQQVHQWHDDMESATSGEGFVSVWMGIKDTTPETSLKVVPGSHTFNRLLFDIADEKKISRDHIVDDVVVEWSDQFQDDSRIELLDTTDGDALFFDGRLWHAQCR